MSNQNINKFSNIPVERKEQEALFGQQSFQQSSFQPSSSLSSSSTVLDKNVSGAEHKLDPSLSFELKYHEQLHHVDQSQIHDASKPVLQTSSDESIRLQPHSSADTLAGIKSSASSMASTISQKATQLKNAAVDKINEFGDDVFPSSSASNAFSSSSSSSNIQHTLPLQVKQEVLHHAPLSHVNKNEIDDQSAPVLSTPTDSMLPKMTVAQMTSLSSSSTPSTSSQISSSLSSAAHTAAEKLEKVGASISQSADKLYDKVIASMSPSSKSSSLSSSSTPPQFAAESTVPLVRQTAPLAIINEVKNHPSLHHVSKNDIIDQSAPMLIAPTDTLKNSSAPAVTFSEKAASSTEKISASLSSAAHVTADALSKAGSSISHKAAEVYQSLSTPSQPAIQHQLPADVKNEVLHHAPLTHVSKNEIDDQSAPVLSTPTDSMLPKLSSAPLATYSTAPSTAEQIKSSLSKAADTISHKAAEVFQSLSSSSSSPSYQRAFPADLKAEILHHAPLSHVSSRDIIDQSAPVLITSTDNMLPKLSPQELQSSYPPSTAAQISSSLSSAAHVTADALGKVGASISHKAAEVYQSIADSTKAPVQHQLPADVKNEVLHHAPLSHVNKNEIDDQSAPVLSTATDSMLPKLSTEKTLGEKLSAVGSSISKSIHDAKITHNIPAHIITPELSNAIKYNQPHLKHVPTADHSAPVLTTETDASLPRIAHHNIAIPTPQHPHIQLHPGKIDLSHVQSTIPPDHSGNMLTKNKFNDSAYEVNEGGLAWSVPLDSNVVEQENLTVTYNTNAPSSSSSKLEQQEPVNFSSSQSSQQNIASNTTTPSA